MKREPSMKPQSDSRTRAQTDGALRLWSSVNHSRASFESHLTRPGWWVTIPHFREQLDWDAAAIENLTAETLPNWDEANYLIAQQRATQHTLSWDWTYDDFDWFLENWRNPWEHDPYGAAMMYSLQAHG